MNETKTTLWFAGSAIVLLILAILLAPGRITPSAFLDQGQPFFPAFTDPNAATTLEIVGFDEATGAPRPFKVTFTGGRWTIPSHHDYPADAKDRLAKTAAAVIEIKKDDFRSDNVADHELCGVVDPLDETAAGATGRGQRVTFKDAQNNVLADFVIGKAVEGRPGFRFARVPGQKRTYAVRMNFDLSAKFEDWIDADLLQIDKGKISQVALHDYSINERTMRIEERDKLVLNLDKGTWNANRMSAGQQVDSAKMQQLLTTIDQLKIVGIRPKPEGLSASLSQAADGKPISTQDVLSLQSKGFFLTREGDMKSNEGELQVRTTEGVVYTLRFGEVLYGSGMAVSAGTEEGADQGAGGTASRYLFITTRFDASILPEPPKPANTEFLNKPDSMRTEADREQKKLYDEHERWKRTFEQGKKKSDDLNARFAQWYYVISADSFDKLHLSRKDLVTAKEKSS
jgi:hypothetical protein